LGDGNALFAVFDGHGSNEVAEFARDNIPKILVGTEEYKNKNYEAALTKTFLLVDTYLKDPERRMAVL